MNIKCFLIEDTGKKSEPDENGIIHTIWKRADNGQEFHGAIPVGAMYYDDDAIDDWCWPGPDGRILYVVTPGGTWCVDSRASNCTKRGDKVHRCWVRHGVPPNITVDKIGNTCAAGAGSILMGKYHGFLRNGELTDC